MSNELIDIPYIWKNLMESILNCFCIEEQDNAEIVAELAAI